MNKFPLYTYIVCTCILCPQYLMHEYSIYSTCVCMVHMGCIVHVCTPYCVCMRTYECTFTFSLCRIGRKSPRLVRAAAMRLSGELFSLLNRSKCAMVTKVLQGCVSSVQYVCVPCIHICACTYIYVLYVRTYVHMYSMRM